MSKSTASFKHVHPTERRSLWNVVSLLTPPAALLISYLAASVYSTLSDSSADYLGLGRLAIALLAFLSSSAFGILAGIVALCRHEQRPWLTATGLIFNGLLTVGLLLFIRLQLQ
jgi:hypothetical protein